jgi:CHAT domain-containing protein
MKISKIIICGAVFLPLFMFSGCGMNQKSGEPRAVQHEKPLFVSDSKSLFATAEMNISREKYSAAAYDYARVGVLAEKSGDYSLAAKACLNAGKASALNNDIPACLEFIRKTEAAVKKLNDNNEKSILLSSISELYCRICGGSGMGIEEKHKNLSKAYETSENALKISGENGDLSAQSLALGSMGKARELSGDLKSALDLTMKAILKASSVDSDTALMRFHWQAGRILGKSGRIDEAVESCREAVYHLEKIRPEISSECRGNPLAFREIIQPVYNELISLLLKRAESRQHNISDLDEVIKTVEKLKTEEIKDYFRDDCITSMQSVVSDNNGIPAGTSVIYPVIMPEELVILVKSEKKTAYFKSGISSDDLAQTVEKLRERLSDPGNRYYLRDSRKLYDLLVKPAEKYLENEKTDTVIFVPDGVLRSIPLAALHDGRQYLVEKYAVGTTPGLSLTAPAPLKKDGSGFLAAGLTEAVQGFSGLPGVSGELEIMESRFDAKALKNMAFSENNLEASLEQAPYSILHIASHGVFDRDPDKTFILTYQGRMNMKGLGRLITNPEIKAPVELITLSACETAAGDERSALGLAGVAIRSGAKSALASLWFVDDDATSKLISGFYDNLEKGKDISKAKALQEAQKTLIRDKHYSHPALWAPFLVIGNWL